VNFTLNFGKIPLTETLDVGTPYDFDSIMHYQNAYLGKQDPNFPSGKLSTIIPKSSRSLILGPNLKGKLSGNDSVMINLTYGCPVIVPPTTTTPAAQPTKVASFLLTMLNVLSTLFAG
jgi:hypothetical protein